MDLSEKKELVFRNYQVCLDIDIAILKARLTDKEKDIILKDQEFLDRLTLVDAEVQEQLIVNLRDLSQSPNDSVRLSATKDLGKIFYQKRFSSDLSKLFDDENNKPACIVLVGKGEDGDKNQDE
jgi:hypothetical protein